MYDFDSIIDRSNTDACKIDLSNKVFGSDDITPLWIADMDFAVAPAVQMAMRQRIEHPIYAYTLCTDRFAKSITKWQQRRNNWTIDPAWVTFTPGVVPALVYSVLAYTKENEGVIIQPPIYPPFFSVVRKNNRIVEENNLVVRDGKYTFNAEEFEQLAAKPTTKLFLLCHPHNPVGYEWTEEELRQMGEICLRHGVTIVSDEIHADLMLFGKQHKPLASLDDSLANITVTLMAASKTFNIAGLSTAYAIISNPELMKQYEAVKEALHIENNMLGCLATQVAYDNCELWLKELLAYLSNNLNYIVDFLGKHIPEITIIKPNATFLLWLDFSRLGLTHRELVELIYRRAKLGLNSGTTFGTQYDQQFRLNFGAPQSVIADALESLKRAVAEIRK